MNQATAGTATTAKTGTYRVARNDAAARDNTMIPGHSRRRHIIPAAASNTTAPASKNNQRSFPANEGRCHSPM